MIISTLAFLALLYIGLRCILPLRKSLAVKAGLFVLAALILGRLHVVRLLYHSWTPEFPFFLNAIWSLLHSALLILVVLGLLSDICRLFMRLVRCRTASGSSHTRQTQGLHPALLPAALLLAAFGTFSALRVPPVTPVEITVPGLPPAWDGLTIAHLADLHVSKTFSTRWLSGVVDAVNAARPDLVVITGDLLDGSPRQRQDDLSPLRRLRAPLGVYACPGNHEYYSGLTQWKPLFASLGLHLLENDHVILRRNGAGLMLAGITDPVAARFHLPPPDVRQATGTASTNTPLILLAHRPDLINQFKQVPRSGAVLQLSGHTHGGQVLGLDRLVSHLNGGYVRGLHAVGNIRLYVSPGTALWSGFPFRLGVPSAIPLLTLRTGEPAREQKP